MIVIMDKDKRNRSMNWETEEKCVLGQIMDPYLEILENKDLSTSINKLKNQAWDDITEQFNKINYRERDKKQIMNQWKVTKFKCKKESSKSNYSTSSSNPMSSTSQPSLAEKRRKFLKNNMFGFGHQSFIKIQKYSAAENERLEKEHELKMKIMQEDHAMKMKILQEESELRRHILYEFHEQLMGNLKLQESFLLQQATRMNGTSNSNIKCEPPS